MSGFDALDINGDGVIDRNEWSQGAFQAPDSITRSLEAERDALWPEVASMSLQLDTRGSPIPRCSRCDQYRIVVRGKDLRLSDYEMQIADLLPLAMRAAEDNGLTPKPKAELITRLEAVQAELETSQSRQLSLQVELNQIRKGSPQAAIKKLEAELKRAQGEIKRLQADGTAAPQNENSTDDVEMEALRKRLQSQNEELSTAQSQLLQFKKQSRKKKVEDKSTKSLQENVLEECQSLRDQILEMKHELNEKEQQLAETSEALIDSHSEAALKDAQIIELQEVLANASDTKDILTKTEIQLRETRSELQEALDTCCQLRKNLEHPEIAEFEAQMDDPQSKDVEIISEHASLDLVSSKEKDDALVSEKI